MFCCVFFLTSVPPGASLQRPGGLAGIEADVNKESVPQGGGAPRESPRGRGTAGTPVPGRGGRWVPTQLAALWLCQESLQPWASVSLESEGPHLRGSLKGCSVPTLTEDPPAAAQGRSSSRNGGGRSPQALKIGAGTERGPLPFQRPHLLPMHLASPGAQGPQGPPGNQPQPRRSHPLRSSAPAPTPQPEVCATEGQPVPGPRGARSCHSS